MKALLVAIVAAVAASCTAAAHTCNVLDYGAKGDGRNNDTDAIQKAISDCSASQGSTVVFPGQKTFLTWPLDVNDAKDMTIVVNGTITAPPDPSQWPNPGIQAFITVQYCPGFTLRGQGTIDGQGAAWWAMRRKDPSKSAPYLVLVKHLSGARVLNVSLVDSPKFHLVLDDVQGPSLVAGVHIQAPADSPNTDGIDPGGSTSGLLVRDVSISNGDDCVAIKPGVSDITVVNISCTNGHGISIGSIGEDGSEGVVTNITVLDSAFVDSQNGCRIKTWQGGKGRVSGIVYDNVTMTRVQNPIRINQYYCPSSQHPKPCTNSSEAVAVSDVVFRGITGTHTEDVAAAVLCSDSTPCRNITLQDIDLQPVGGKKNEFQVWQAYGTAKNVTPPADMWGP